MRLRKAAVGVRLAVGCACAGAIISLLMLTSSVSASPQARNPVKDALRTLRQGKYADAARLAEQFRAEHPGKASSLRGAALAMQRQYAQALPELERAANATANTPRPMSTYESLTAMRIACLAMSGQRQQAAQLAKSFNRETATRYAEQYPRPAILYGILIGAAMPETAFTPAEAQKILQYEDPAYEVRYYEQHLRAYLQTRQRQYRPALASLRRTYTDPKITAGVRSAPQPETLLVEAYLHQQLGETAKMRTRLRDAEQQLQNAMRRTDDEQKVMHYCALALLGRMLFQQEWKL